MKNKECFYSSTFFFINAIIAYHYEYYEYSLSFLFLAITSLFHHYYFNNLTRQIDKLAIIIMLYYTILIFYIKINNNIINSVHLILYAIIYSIIVYLYSYGYNTKKYCYDTDHSIACLWHSLLHLLTASSHIILILL